MSSNQRFRNSSSFRVFLIHSGLLLFSILSVVLFISLLNNKAVIAETEAAIDADLLMFEKLEESQGIEFVINLIEQRANHSEEDSFFSIRNQNGEIIGGNLTTWPINQQEPVVGVVNIRDDLIKFKVRFAESQMEPQDLSLFEDHWDILARIIKFDDGYEILVGRDIEYIESAMWIVAHMGWGAIGVMLLILFLQFWFGLSLVKKINSISTTAARIMETGNLSERIPVTRKKDDINQLAHTLNLMLEEIENNVHNIRRITDNIAHDLRTPLTKLRTRIETIENTAQREMLIHETDGIISMFNSLLRIASIESCQLKSAFQKIHMGEIIKDVITLYDPLIEKKSLELTQMIQPQDFYGDRNLLFQAFANILDNAVKYSKEGGKIEISLRKNLNQIQLIIADNGPGIPMEKRDKVFQPFYRMDESRHTSGHGLGLSLVNAIIKVHHGKIRLEENQPGLKVQVDFIP